METPEQAETPPVQETANMSLGNEVVDEEEHSKEATNTEEPQDQAETPLEQNDDKNDSSSCASSSSFDSFSTSSTIERDATDDSPFEDNAKPKRSSENVEDSLVQALSLKEEGNAFFKEGNFVNASRSYRRGVAKIKKFNHQKTTGHDQIQSLLVTLYTNLSMVFVKLTKHNKSCDMATKALEIQPNNVKALYRRAVAQRHLGNCNQAKQDLKLALKLDKDNVSVKRELISLKRDMEAIQKVQRQQMRKAFSSSLYKDKQRQEQERQLKQQEEQQAKEEFLKKRKQRWEDDCVKLMSDSQEPIPYEEWDKLEKEKEEAEQKQKEEEEKERQLQDELRRNEQRAKKKLEQHESSSDEEEDALTEEELKLMRGYKKTSDGRTTSYFTREQSLQEKQLIGDIAPKRIDASTDTTPIVTASTSAWNRAGTWEERDTTDWCSQQLQQHLVHAAVVTDELEAKIIKADSVTGHASVALMGADKKQYIFDFHANLEYEIMSCDQVILASGTLNLPDISSVSAAHELEILVEKWTKAPPTHKENKAVDCRNDLIQAVRASVQAFVKDFNQHY